LWGKKSYFKEIAMSEKKIVAFGFDHNGKHYVIKVFQIENKYIVKPYLNDMEASHYSYSVEVDDMAAWENLYGGKLPYVRLVEIAELDLKEGNGLRKLA
jgi:hypothetical protein